VNTVDVAIIGGGPSGAAASLSLRQLLPQAAIALFDSAPAGKWKPGETLSPTAVPLLQSLGCWPSLHAAFQDGMAAQSFGTQAAWGASHLSEREFLFSLFGNGWRLDRKQFDAALLNSAEAARVEVQREMRLKESAADREGYWRLSFAVGQYRARFVIDATGRTAWFARQLGTRISLDDRLAGVFVRFEVENEWDTLVEARASGWWYSTGLPNGAAVVAWMSDTDLIREMNLKTARCWHAQLAESVHTKQRVQNARSQGLPMIFAARSQILRPMGGRGWVATGDAAMAFDPLSSQGITKALRSGKLASFVAADYLLRGSDTHQRYEQIAEQEYADYRRAKHTYYCEEQRWPTAPFWARRHTSA
jgi:flavin-dependent dehydrogenase